MDKELESEKYQNFWKKVQELGFVHFIPYTRHSHFIPDGSPACDVCGEKTLVSGVGRYIIFDPEREDDLAVYLCGHCVEKLEEGGAPLDYM